MGGCIGTTGGEWQEAHAEERLKEAHFSFALVSRQGSRDHEDYAKASNENMPRVETLAAESLTRCELSPCRFLR